MSTAGFLTDLPSVPTDHISGDPQINISVMVGVVVVEPAQIPAVTCQARLDFVPAVQLAGRIVSSVPAQSVVRNNILTGRTPFNILAGHLLPTGTS